jgi:hypothetical protein
MAAQTHEAFTSFAKHMSEKSSGAWRASQSSVFAAVALHSAISESTARQFAQCVPLAGAMGPQPDHYRDMRLLVPP